MNDIFRQIAKENGTTEKAVKEEMQFAIREAMKSAEPEAIAFWKAVAPDGKEPPIEKVIAMIALNVNNRMYNCGASASLFLILKNVVSGVIKK